MESPIDRGSRRWRRADAETVSGGARKAVPPIRDAQFGEDVVGIVGFDIDDRGAVVGIEPPDLQAVSGPAEPLYHREPDRVRPVPAAGREHPGERQVLAPARVDHRTIPGGIAAVHPEEHDEVRVAFEPSDSLGIGFVDHDLGNHLGPQTRYVRLRDAMPDVSDGPERDGVQA